MKTLYLTHYGILEPLGQSQILPYLLGLADIGHQIQIISSEKPAQLNQVEWVGTQRDLLSRHKISWQPRRYRGGRSIAQLLVELVKSSRDIRIRCAQNRPDLIHCRSHVPFLMACLGTTFQKFPLLFDFRGFMAEEYVDSRLWPPGGARYRLTKRLERAFCRSSSAIVVLTKPGKEYLQKVYALNPDKIFVIPCCVDQSKFFARSSQESAQPGRPLRVVYSGSTLGRYNIPAIFDFFVLLRQHRPGSHLTLLSNNDLELVKHMAAKSCLPDDSVSFCSLPHSQVPEMLAAQDLGLFFLHGELTLLVASPTKLGEYLASGLVVVAEERLGDIREILQDPGVGCLIDSRRPTTWPPVVEKALQLCDAPDFREKSMRTASRHFSLRDGIESYARAYEFAVRKAI